MVYRIVFTLSCVPCPVSPVLCPVSPVFCPQSCVPCPLSSEQPCRGREWAVPGGGLLSVHRPPRLGSVLSNAQCSAQCSAVQCSAVLCSAVQCSAVCMPLGTTQPDNI
jgi:hypothetical protein